MHVVWQEPDADPDHDDGQHRPRIAIEEEPLIAQTNGVEEERGSGDRHDAGRQAVQPVGQVQGVGQENHPDHCEQGRQVWREQHHVEERDTQYDQRHAGQRQHAAGEHHPSHLGRCRDGSNVVDHPDGADDHRSRDHAHHLRWSGEHLGEVAHQPGGQDSGKQTQEHGRPTETRGGGDMDVAFAGNDQ